MPNFDSRGRENSVEFCHNKPNGFWLTVMEGSDDESAVFSMFSKKVKTTPSKAKETKEIVLQREKHVVKEAEERLTFSDLGLNQWVVKCCQSMGIVKPTPVQVFPQASFHP